MKCATQIILLVFIFFEGFYIGKMWTFLGKQPFFRVDMGKYHTGRYGRIGSIWYIDFLRPYGCMILIVKCLGPWLCAGECDKSEIETYLGLSSLGQGE